MKNFIKHDIHLHTYLSKCCHHEDQTPANIIKIAKELGLEMIGFADHVWTNPDLKPNGFYQGQHENQIIDLRRDLGSLDTDLRILVGCEADTIAPGKFSITAEFAEKLDYVLLACNHLHIHDLIAQPESDKPCDIAAHLLTMFRSGVQCGWATSIVHAFMPLGFPDSFEKVIEEISDEEFLDAFGIAAENDVAIEITLGYLCGKYKDDPDSELSWSLDTPGRILSMAKKAGCRFTFGSDAHNLAYMRFLPKLSLLIDAAGIEKEDVLNI
jgi:histidinol phosphatase-like PHP family hydrolase